MEQPSVNVAVWPGRKPHYYVTVIQECQKNRAKSRRVSAQCACDHSRGLKSALQLLLYSSSHWNICQGMYITLMYSSCTSRTRRGWNLCC